MKLTKNRLTRRLSPRMRGCFHNERRKRQSQSAFPAYAGMFLITMTTAASDKGFPRVCGDVSTAHWRLLSCLGLSPRMRGCFYQNAPTTYQNKAFPAYAGMFLVRMLTDGSTTSFPRVCGDVSNASSSPFARLRLSPRMRGCFLLSLLMFC